MDSIIFDLDGTLWDSTEQLTTVWNQVIERENRELNLITVSQLRGVMGLQMEEIGERLYPNLSKEEKIEIFEKFSVAECDYIKNYGGCLYPNVEATLKQLAKKYKLYIVSNCQSGYIEAFFHFHQLGGYFLDFENPGRTGLSKAENIQLIMERNQLKAPVYVGDTNGDLNAARKAGIPFVYASYGFGELEEFDYLLNEFADLTKIF